MIRLISALIFILQTQLALPCSFAEGYQPFLYTPTEVGKAPKKPAISVASIKRGYNDGNFASCSDAGVLTLELSEENSPALTGYSFEIIEGAFDDHVFPNYPVSIVPANASERQLVFVWLDGSSNHQEPINVKVKVRALSNTGVISGPTVLHIVHAGSKSH